MWWGGGVFQKNNLGNSKLTSPIMTQSPGFTSKSSIAERKKDFSGFPTTSALQSQAYSNPATNGPVTCRKVWINKLLDLYTMQTLISAGAHAFAGFFFSLQNGYIDVL